MGVTSQNGPFKSVYGMSIAAHIKEHRMEEAAEFLRDEKLSLAEVAAKVGYTNQSKFTAAFKNRFGMLPKEYRKRAEESARNRAKSADIENGDL